MPKRPWTGFLALRDIANRDVGWKLEKAAGQVSARIEASTPWGEAVTSGHFLVKHRLSLRAEAEKEFFGAKTRAFALSPSPST